MFREPEEKKMFEMDNLVAASTESDELNIDIQKNSGTKDTSGPLSSVNPPISVASPKTNFIQHRLKICFANQNTLLCIFKYLPTNTIKAPITIWSWD